MFACFFGGIEAAQCDCLIDTPAVAYLMRKRVLRRKPFLVDGLRYEVSVTATYEAHVTLRVTIRAGFGNSSYCTIMGLHNVDYYYNHGYWNDKTFSEASDTISITPRLIASLIRYARNRGWSPETSKSNQQLDITNVDAKSLPGLG
jgi:hypothetical protein